MEEKENSVVVNIEHKQLKVHSLRFDKTKLVINDEYELKQEGDTYYIVRKQPTYPKTYEECCEVIDYKLLGTMIIGYKAVVLKTFQKLLICRDAYWKIAGEEMGLDKPWEYDMSEKEFIYAIAYQYGYIQKCEVRYKNHILAFPTSEMRDAFLKNFRELIEKCKELL